MKVLFALNEAYPIYKIGGLGDVGGSLPPALEQLGIDVRLVIPHHPEIHPSTDWHLIDNFTLTYARKKLPVNIFSTYLPSTKVPLYLINESEYLSTHTDASDNHADKYTVFSLSIAHWLSRQKNYWQPHLIHCHDWHTALVPVFLRHKFQLPIKSVLTIHNLAYQGNTATPVLKHSSLDPQSCQILKWDSLDHHLNILMEGLLHADLITTVSPTYAQEILSKEHGHELDPILTAKKDHLVGILNGINTLDFDPARDPHLPVHFDSSNVQSTKIELKQVLFQKLKLPDNTGPLIGFVGRVDPQQKGVELIINAISHSLLPPTNSTFAFLGTGDPYQEQALHQVSSGKSNISITTRYDEPLARLIYAASDLLLIPSLYEPCGLVQLIAMRYGSLPVARNTGGLKDTIKHLQTGFLFHHYSVSSMMSGLTEALLAISDPNKHRQMISTAMSQDFSWNQSAKMYHQLYRELID
jgi:starch synthase